ncbi:MAG: hypothetical protein JW724_00250 [Candidatus Altiarchaeota archaeon]|nr:hypothetical protein [Candidatus Altiarchaeota archaeon]
MIEELVDFKNLSDFLKSSDLKYREALMAYYKSLGESLGFTVRENASIIRNGVNFGRIDLIWLEPNVTFTAEFGDIDGIYKHLWRIIEFNPNMAVLLLSSKSSCKADDVTKIIEKSGILEGKRGSFLVLDVTCGKVLRRP